METVRQQSAAQMKPPREGDLFERVGRVLSEIETLKKERQAEPVQEARLRIGAFYARARLHKRAEAPGRRSH